MQKPFAEDFPSEGISFNWEGKENLDYNASTTTPESDRSDSSPWNLHLTPNRTPFLDFSVRSGPPSSWILRWGPPATPSAGSTRDYVSKSVTRRSIDGEEEGTHRGVHVSGRVAVGVCQHGDNANHDCLYRVDGEPTLLRLFISKLIFSGFVQNWDANVPVLPNCEEQEPGLDSKNQLYFICQVWGMKRPKITPVH